MPTKRKFKSKKHYHQYLSEKALSQWESGSLKGFKKSNEVKKKIALAHLGKNFVSKSVRSNATKTWIRERGHPRGMLGKTHSLETRKHFSEIRKGGHFNLSHKERCRRSDAMRKITIKNKQMWGNNKWHHIKRGFREDISDGKIFFRSAREANYARFLNWKIEKGEIKSWEYEPKTFVFHKIELGVRSYTPDFKVILQDGKEEYHEIKGYMDSKSQTKLNRMKKYYPDVKLILIEGQKEFKNLTQNASRDIEEWEGKVPKRKL